VDHAVIKFGIDESRRANGAGPHGLPQGLGAFPENIARSRRHAQGSAKPGRVAIEKSYERHAHVQKRNRLRIRPH
jgi:hypothetical protein